MMESTTRNIIPSGIEPVDKLMGGLESGQLYLVHGDASGKSLFGIKFLIEGLRRGENGALVIRYSPEDAVRRFARLGYDCLEDVYSGRLVILEYSDDIIQQIARLRELTPVLRELEWLLGETKPQRVIFDPVASLVLGEEGRLDERVREFASWARSFGATVTLIANGESQEIIEHFKPLVEESFRFEVKETSDRATRFIAFEKSSEIPDQAIEVDPARGVFLLGRAQPQEQPAILIEAEPAVIEDVDLLDVEAEPLAPLDDYRGEDEGQVLDIQEDQDVSLSDEIDADLIDFLVPEFDESVSTDEPPPYEPLKPEYEFFKLTNLSDIQNSAAAVADEQPEETVTESVIETAPDDAEIESAEIEGAEIQTAAASGSRDTKPLEGPTQLDLASSSDDEFQDSYQAEEQNADELSFLLDDLADEVSPLDLDAAEWTEAEATQAQSAQATQDQIIQDQATAPAPQNLDAQNLDAQNLNATAKALPVAKDSSSQVAPDEMNEKVDSDVQPQTALSSDESERPALAQEEITSAIEPDIDSVITARAVELLLRPPDSKTEFSSHTNSASHSAARSASHAASAADAAIDPKDFNVLIIDDVPSSYELIAQSLSEYTVEIVHDGVSGLAKLISFKPDLVIIDVDLPIIDGFKVLAHIRASLNMPIIIMSSSHMRASDRVLSADLGADYYLTKPFSIKELRQKARQLIARYRGISSWIVNSPPGSDARASVYNQNRGEHEMNRSSAHLHSSLISGSGHFTSYDDFVAQVEKRVRAALDNGSSFSIVGCRLPNMTAYGGLVAIHLFELVSTLVRESDMISTNARNDLVILLTDADATGARAFIGRLRERVIEEVNHEPSVWMRSFPNLEEAIEATDNHNSSNGHNLNRRVSDRQGQAGGDMNLDPFINPADSEAATDMANRPASPEAYTDLIKHL